MNASIILLAVAVAACAPVQPAAQFCLIRVVPAQPATENVVAVWYKCRPEVEK